MTMNPDLVRARCAEIEESIARLEQFKQLSPSQFTADQDKVDIACYRLLIAIEAALALCYHACAKKIHRTPDDYASCFRNLAQAAIIPQDLAERLERLARLRNLLVHRYWVIDHVRVHEIIRQDLNDLRQFAAAMAQLV